MSHLKRTTHIHAPLPEVYRRAHDPAHWSDWYVGISNEGELGTAAAPRYLMVGTPFPLTQKVLEDHVSRNHAHWHARVEGPAERVEVSPSCCLLMLPAESDWTYVASAGGTEVTVTLDYDVPSRMIWRAEDRDVIDRLEARCLERSLENLKRLCETTH